MSRKLHKHEATEIDLELCKDFKQLSKDEFFKMSKKERKLYKEQAASIRTRLRIDPEDALPEDMARQINRQQKEAFKKIDEEKKARLAERDAAFQETSMNIQNERDQAEKALIPTESNEGKKIAKAVVEEKPVAAEGFSSGETTRQLGILISTALQQLGALEKISMSVQKDTGGLQ